MTPSPESTQLADLIDISGIKDDATRSAMARCIRMLDLNRGGDEVRDRQIRELEARVAELEEWRDSVKADRAGRYEWVKWALATVPGIVFGLWAILVGS